MLNIRKGDDRSFLMQIVPCARAEGVGRLVVKRILNQLSNEALCGGIRDFFLLSEAPTLK